MLRERPNQIGPEAATALATLIRASPALRALDLTGNPLDPEAVRLLLEAIETQPSFHELRVSVDLPASLRDRLHRVLTDHRNRRPPPPVPAELLAIRSVYRTAKRPGASLETAKPKPAPAPLTAQDRGFSDAELAACRKVLDAIAVRRGMIEHPSLSDLGVRMTQILRTGRRGPKRARPKSAAPTEATATGESSTRPASATRGPKAQTCYICKTSIVQRHAFYGLMCERCGRENFAKRSRSVDLTGRVAVVTGGRIKIGHEVALSLLRNGASVVVTTRFARDAARRFAGAEDFETWRRRLTIVGLDLVHTPSVEAFAAELGRSLPRLDILINNAAQTVRRPRAFYRDLWAAEQADDRELAPPRSGLARAVQVARPSPGLRRFLGRHSF